MSEYAGSPEHVAELEAEMIRLDVLVSEWTERSLDCSRRFAASQKRVDELERALAVVPHFQKMWVALPEDVKLILDAREGLSAPRRRWWRLFKQAPTPAKPPSGEGQSV